MTTERLLHLWPLQLRDQVGNQVGKGGDCSSQVKLMGQLVSKPSPDRCEALRGLIRSGSPASCLHTGVS